MNHHRVLIGIVLVILLFILIVLLRFLFARKKKHRNHFYPSFHLTRAACNPLLTPDQGWESEGTFNGAVVKDTSGFHVFYRAIGEDGVSRIGYAHSANGLTIGHRLSYPIFSLHYINTHVPMQYDPVMYPSGGSWGGCEDPRAVTIDGRIYMTFSAFEDWQSIRIGVVSISAEDLARGKWKWSTPMLISPKNEQNKNWVLFPEKINGKFAIIHSITPSIMVDYVDTLEELAYGTTTIQSRSHPQQGGRKEYWDNRIRGAGPPPIKTDKGWLLLYHAISHHESHMYKLGVLLLDLNDPSKVIARSPTPILTPMEWYENDWKPGIIYACGATIHDDTLSVYYGGGDKYLCVAHASVSKLLSWLTKYGTLH